MQLLSTSISSSVGLGVGYRVRLDGSTVLVKKKLSSKFFCFSIAANLNRKCRGDLDEEEKSGFCRKSKKGISSVG